MENYGQVVQAWLLSRDKKTKILKKLFGENLSIS